MTGGWREARPELAIAALTVLALCGAAFAFAGAAAAVITLAAAGAGLLAVLRGLAPPDDTPPPYEEPAGERAQTTFTGFWRRRAGVEAATQTMTGYDFELRGTLQHLLAARLAERHGISLHDDPDAARRLLCPRPRDDALWYWVDPARAPAQAGKQPGIPPRTLARLIDRLEQL